MPYPMRDVIVLIPGTLGTTLLKDGREVWGLSGAAALTNILSLGGAIKQLKLPDGIGHADPQDGVVAGLPLPGLSMIPTLWKVDGYGHLRDFLKARLTLTTSMPGNFIEFGYNWRLSNQLNARLPADGVMPKLERW